MDKDRREGIIVFSSLGYFLIGMSLTMMPAFCRAGGTNAEVLTDQQINRLFSGSPTRVIRLKKEDPTPPKPKPKPKPQPKKKPTATDQLLAQAVTKPVKAAPEPVATITVCFAPGPESEHNHTASYKLYACEGKCTREGTWMQVPVEMTPSSCKDPTASRSACQNPSSLCFVTHEVAWKIGDWWSFYLTAVNQWGGESEPTSIVARKLEPPRPPTPAAFNVQVQYVGDTP